MFRGKFIISLHFVTYFVFVKTISVQPPSEKYDKTSNSAEIYEIFHEKDINTNKKVEYRIQDVPESKFQDALNLMLEYYNTLEPMNKMLGM